jgi:hypothetical protein
MYDFTLERTVWFSAKDGHDYIVHIVTKDLIKRAASNDTKGYENLLRIVRRYE